MSKKYGTYLIEFSDGESIVCGNNYKPWWQHATEYIYGRYGYKEMGWRFKDIKDIVKSVKYSGVPFIDDGGLKWATLEGYQEVIDDVAKLEHQQFTPLKDIKFINSSVDKATLTKKLKEY